MQVIYFFRLFILFLLLSGAIRNAEAETLPGEYQVKAVFIYNFAKFIEWPADSFPSETSPFVITILGKNPYGEAFEPLSGKPVKKRRVEIRRAARIEDADSSQILFITGTDKHNLAHVLERSRDKSILTISDGKNFAQEGGGITLVTVEGKIRFDINLSAARNSGLKISSQLLKLARTVID